MFIRYPDSGRPDGVLINLIKIILYNNDFTFNGNNYLQKKGVAMGQTFAPSIANIYLVLWEEEIKRTCPTFPVVWFRYIDDIFAIWNGTFNMLSNFISIVNNINPNIKITHSADNAFCIFLDLHLYKLNNQLCHKIHFKDTNSHSILHPSSNHPKHIFKIIIYSHIRRCPSLV